MTEVTLEGLAPNAEEGTVQTWFFEEGDNIAEGDDLVELSTEGGVVTIQAPASGVLAEVYYDEGEVVGKGEILCTIDDDGAEDRDDEDEDEEDDDDADEDEDEDEESDDEEEDFDEDEEDEK